MKKRILLVCNTSWGIYNFRLGVIRALQNQGYDVYAIAPEDDTSVKLAENGVRIHNIAMDNKGTSPIKDIWLCLKLIKLYKKIRPDLIFHYTIKPNIYGSLAAKFSGVKSIAFVTGAGYAFNGYSWVSVVVEKLFKLAFVFPKRVWFLNTEDTQLFVERGLVNKQKVEILPGEGINTSLFESEILTNNETSVKFLFFSRLLWDKGIGEYVEAARIIKKKYKNTEFKVLGFLDWNNPEAVNSADMDHWEKEGIVEYLGSTNNVKEYIIDSSCIVLPSYYREGVPRTLLEAASLCKPIITTNHIGCKEVVDDGVNGFLCKIKDPTDLALKMENIINMPIDDQLKMGMKGREKVMKEFDESIIINKYLRTIGEELDVQ